MIARTTAATGLAWIPRGPGSLAAGSRVRFLPL